MEKLKKLKKNWFAVALIVSVSTVAAIPGIIFGAIWHMWVLMAFCIAVVAHGFYGVIFYWIAFSERCFLLRLCTAIERERLLTVAELAVHLGRTEAVIRNSIFRCIQRGWLTGFIFNGAVLVPNVRKAPDPLELQPTSVVCPSCGAQVELSDSLRCEYCGRRFKKR